MIPVNLHKLSEDEGIECKRVIVRVERDKSKRGRKCDDTEVPGTFWGGTDDVGRREGALPTKQMVPIVRSL
jgi:hypothetical protein